MRHLSRITCLPKCVTEAEEHKSICQKTSTPTSTRETPELLEITGDGGVERNKQVEDNRWKEREQSKQVEQMLEWVSSRIG